VKAVLVKAVRPSGAAVLNAADDLVAAMADVCPGRVCFFAVDPDHPRLVAHRETGGPSVFLRDGVLVLSEGPTNWPVLAVADVPMTHGGRVRFQVENVLAGAGAAWMAGCPVEAIREGLRDFRADLRQVPGRFNVLTRQGATVIIDYGHNVDAVRAVGASLPAFPHERRLAMFTVAGDRRDQDILDQGALLGDLFDMVMIYEESCVRGRSPGEILSLMREGLSRGRRVSEVIEAPGEFAAVSAILDRLRPGDLALIQPDRVDAVVAHVAAVMEGRPDEVVPYGPEASARRADTDEEALPARPRVLWEDGSD
jgi:cyanophycin synthetase